MFLIPKFIKDKITSWAIQLLNIDTITAEQREEIQELLKADSEKAFNRMVEIFKETTTKQQEIIKQLTKENKELKEKVKEMETERKEAIDGLTEIEEMSEFFKRDPENALKWWEEESKKYEQEALIEANKSKNI